MLVEIRSAPFDPWLEVSGYLQQSDLAVGCYGACAAFVGSMRDYNLGDSVMKMELEHYAGMTQRLLSDYAEIIIEKYSLIDLMILHRIGVIYPGEPIVLVAAWAAHRTVAFDGCRDMMEHLKSKATFWKRETLSKSGEQRWVDNP